jgi:hypothetical protein
MQDIEELTSPWNIRKEATGNGSMAVYRTTQRGEAEAVFQRFLKFLGCRKPI